MECLLDRGDKVTSLFLCRFLDLRPGRDVVDDAIDIASILSNGSDCFRRGRPRERGVDGVGSLSFAAHVILVCFFCKLIGVFFI